jgi:hypothetical protein
MFIRVAMLSTTDFGMMTVEQVAFFMAAINAGPSSEPLALIVQVLEAAEIKVANATTNARTERFRM